MSHLERRFEEHLESSRLLEGVSSLGVAFSGGGDSTALLVLLDRWARPRAIPLLAAHVSHGLRGEAGERDALAASELARSLAVDFVLREADVRRLRGRGESLEAAARHHRYRTLLALAAELGPGTLVATGHTRDDQAETVLLNLARHSGRSRGGIQARRQDGVVRPLLPFSRGEVRDFLLSLGIGWQEDETNGDDRLMRNRIRRHILPRLEAESPGASARLARAAEGWTRRLSGLDEEIGRALLLEGAPLGGPWPRELLRRLDREAAGRLLILALGQGNAVPGRAQVRRVLSRLFGGEEKFAETVGGQRVHVDARAVRLVRLVRPDRLRR